MFTSLTLYTKEIRFTCILLFSALLFFLCSSQPTAAQNLQTPLQFTTWGELFQGILNVVILLAFPVIVLFLVYAGFLFISAQGNPEKLTQARRIFIWTLIGALLVLGGRALSIAIDDTITQIAP